VYLLMLQQSSLARVVATTCAALEALYRQLETYSKAYLQEHKRKALNPLE
jgi:hypothetical protein